MQGTAPRAYEKIFAMMSVSKSAPPTTATNSAMSFHGGSAFACIAAARSQSVCGYCAPTGDIKFAAAFASSGAFAYGERWLFGSELGARSVDIGRPPPGITG